MPKKKLRPKISTVSFTARPGRARTAEEFQADLVAICWRTSQALTICGGGCRRVSRR